MSESATRIFEYPIPSDIGSVTNLGGIVSSKFYDITQAKSTSA